MELVSIIAFIAFGIALVILEVVFVPGTTIVGIGGLVCSGYGIYLAFEAYGVTGGVVSIALTTAFGLGAMLYSFKNKAWERFSLKQKMDNVVNEEQLSDLQVGEVGETLSSLRPIGKALFSDKEYEVTSLGGWIGEHEQVKIIKIDNHKIFVDLVA